MVHKIDILILSLNALPEVNTNPLLLCMGFRARSFIGTVHRWVCLL